MTIRMALTFMLASGSITYVVDMKGAFLWKILSWRKDLHQGAIGIQGFQ
jgi:hypothetical protein